MKPSFSQLGQWLTGLWQSPDFVLVVVPVATSVMAVIGMYVLWRFSRLSHRPGIHYSPEAAQWAARHFPEFQPPVAAYLATLLLEQIGLTWKDLFREADLRGDLLMTESEIKELGRELRKELQVEIPPAIANGFGTVQDVVEYLEHCLMEEVAPPQVATPAGSMS